jgi:hypothetical protein
MNFIGPLEDRIAIRELLDTYSDAVTRQDGKLWASVWLDSRDAKWMLPSMAAWARFEGKATIVDEWQKMMAQFHSADGKRMAITQVTVPGKIIIKGDTAEVRSYTTEFFANAQGETLHTKGQYDDHCVKQAGEWFFKERTWSLFPLGNFQKIQTEKA